MLINRHGARSAASVSLVALCLATFALAGCERKERILEVQTPAGDVEADRNIDTGEVEVRVNENER